MPPFIPTALLALAIASVAAAADTAPKSVPSGRVVPLTYQNRVITELRATVLSHSPEQRVESIQQRLDNLVAQGIVGPVEIRKYEELTTITVGPHIVFAIAPDDIDEMAGETIENKAARATAALGTALQEAVELRTPGRLIRAGLEAAAATVLLVLLLWGIRAADRVAERRLVAAASERLRRVSIGDSHVLQASRVLELMRRLVMLIAFLAGAFVLYSWLTFVLRRFPYTRPWGESMRAYFFDTLSHLALGFAHALPGLFTVFVIFLIARVVIRVLNALFEGVERQRLSLPYVYPETAQPTRRLVNGLIWVFALVVAYPYLPGSGTDAFKGVSVFLGLIISLGSSGLVNQVMSGFMITYSRALRLGDYVRVGEVEGTVTHVGILSTKVKTPRREEVTIPNAVLVSNTTTNFSKFADSDGVYVPTAVTIGYDAPWRQVEALLLMAADRTEGVRREPKPVVLQTALQDFYVHYTLLVSLEQPHVRGPVLNRLHANIQDVFNEYGVQIMSPNYEADPAAPKIVPKDRWFEAPGRDTSGTGGGATP